MSNLIDSVFADRRKIKIMTHIVGGYPDIAANIRTVYAMAECGVDMVEVQIPFSDPIADGPVITEANQAALESGITPEDCFSLIRELSKTVNIPILIMTYFNIPFTMGVENFINMSADSGASGLIMPDIPFDEEEHKYIKTAESRGLYVIPVVSPDVLENRLKDALEHRKGFVYATLKVGITGSSGNISEEGIGYLKKIRNASSLPVASGFGISSPEHLKILKGKTDAVVIGSHILKLMQRGGIEEVIDFLNECIKVV